MKRSKKSKVIDRKIKNEETEISTIIKIAVGVLLFFGIIYLLFSILTGQITFKKAKKEPVKIQYSEILAEQTFKQNESDYFVLFYDFDSEESSLIKTIGSKLSQTAAVYEVDLSKKFNDSYIADEVNNSVQDLSQLKVKHPTLLRLNNNKVIKVVSGLENIKNYSLDIK